MQIVGIKIPWKDQLLGEEKHLKDEEWDWASFAFGMKLEEDLDLEGDLH